MHSSCLHRPNGSASRLRRRLDLQYATSLASSNPTTRPRPRSPHRRKIVQPRIQQRHFILRQQPLRHKRMIASPHIRRDVLLARSQLKPRKHLHNLRVLQVPRNLILKVPHQVVVIALLPHRRAMKQHWPPIRPAHPLRDKRSPDIRHPKTAQCRQVQHWKCRRKPRRVLTIERTPRPIPKPHTLRILKRHRQRPAQPIHRIHIRILIRQPLLNRTRHLPHRRTRKPRHTLVNPIQRQPPRPNRRLGALSTHNIPTLHKVPIHIHPTLRTIPLRISHRRTRHNAHPLLRTARTIKLVFSFTDA